jgi:hypothetical protein
MRKDMMEERREVHCLRDSLSEQDFERVGGASGREGLRRTVPRAEKKALPCRVWRERDVVWFESVVEIEGSGGVEVAATSSMVPFEVGGSSHGVESSWEAIVSSMLASPPITY